MMSIKKHVQVLLIPKIMSSTMYSTIHRMGVRGLFSVFWGQPKKTAKKASSSHPPLFFESLNYHRLWI